MERSLIKFLKHKLRQKVFIQVCIFVCLLMVIINILFINCSNISSNPSDWSEYLLRSPISSQIDFSSIVQQVATNHSHLFNESSCDIDNFEFVDLVVEELRKIDPRFGYAGQDCDIEGCSGIASYQVAFYTGSATKSTEADNSTDIDVFNIIDGYCCTDGCTKAIWEQNRDHLGTQWKFSKHRKIGMVYRLGCGLKDILSLTHSSCRQGMQGQYRPDALIKNLALEHPDAFNNACNDWAFIDIVVEELRSQWGYSYGPEGSIELWELGYNCHLGDCNDISKSQVAFYLGNSRDDVENSTNIAVIDIVDNPCNDPKAIWKQRVAPNGRWKYSRDTSDESP